MNILMLAGAWATFVHAGTLTAYDASFSVTVPTGYNESPPSIWSPSVRPALAIQKGRKVGRTNLPLLFLLHVDGDDAAVVARKERGAAVARENPNYSPAAVVQIPLRADLTAYGYSDGKTDCGADEKPCGNWFIYLPWGSRTLKAVCWEQETSLCRKILASIRKAGEAEKTGGSGKERRRSAGSP
ncbi:MAG: hypothetical protein WC969_14575 [Elusimicrobiota bacterium]